MKKIRWIAKSSDGSRWDLFQKETYAGRIWKVRENWYWGVSQQTLIGPSRGKTRSIFEASSQLLNVVKNSS